MTEAELAALVTRDAMIGVTTVKSPAAGQGSAHERPRICQAARQ